MLISKPDYYEEFHCTADRCEDTCCAGWQIVIDEDALEKYRKAIQAEKTSGSFWEEGSFGKRLKKSVDWKERVFYQDGAKRCAFLNEKNLCDLYTALGEESLCKTCTNYPRHIEEFENVREYTLSVSCPEVARILLNKKEPVRFLEEETDTEEEFEEFDFLLYSQLVDTREVMLCILQNRELDIWFRAYLVWEIGREMQEYMDEERLFACEEIFEKYETAEFWKERQEQLEAWKTDTDIKQICPCSTAGKSSYEVSLSFYENLYELELLREDWDKHLQETAAILYAPGQEFYDVLHAEFKEWLQREMPDYTIWLEQLLVYFIQTYFCGAVYDGYIASKAKMSVVSVWLIYEMLAARWYRNGKMLDMEDVILIVYRYSRELEHSDLNLETMEELLDEEEIDV